MPDSNPPPPPPPPRPIDDWFGGESPTPPDRSADPPLAPDELPVAPVVAPVVRTRLANPLTEKRMSANTGPRVNPRPADYSPRADREDRAPETERPRAQVFLACSVLLAIIAAMIVAVAVLGYALIEGFKKAQSRAKKADNRPPVLRRDNPPPRPGNPFQPADADRE